MDCRAPAHSVASITIAAILAASGVAPAGELAPNERDRALIAAAYGNHVPVARLLIVAGAR